MTEVRSSANPGAGLVDPSGCRSTPVTPPLPSMIQLVRAPASS
jgi:hypothetical protein